MAGRAVLAFVLLLGLLCQVSAALPSRRSRSARAYIDGAFGSTKAESALFASGCPTGKGFCFYGSHGAEGGCCIDVVNDRVVIPSCFWGIINGDTWIGTPAPGGRAHTLQKLLDDAKIVVDKDASWIDAVRVHDRPS